MTARQPCPPAPGPLEGYAAAFDGCFRTLAQRRGFREYLTGLLLPRDRNKTLTALAGAEPVVGAQGAAVQRLQFFLSEAAWDADAVTDARLAQLLADPLTAPRDDGVLVLDDTGDRKDGTATAHVGRQYLGSVGKIDNGVVAVTSLWADARVYYPLDVAPYTPAGWFAEGKQAPGFRTKPQLALALVARARALGLPFRAVVADSVYGDHLGLDRALTAAPVPYVLAHRGSVSRGWAKGDVAHSFAEALEELPRGAWIAVERSFRDGHTEAWWAADLTFLGYGPDRPVRAVVATTDRDALPALSTWYLTTNLSAADAPLAEVVRLYGLRIWVEEGYKRVKGELGWADYQVRSDRAIRRHWALVCCAFCFCWWHAAAAAAAAPNETPGDTPNAAPPGAPARGENRRPPRRPRRRAGPSRCAACARGSPRRRGSGAAGGPGPARPRRRPWPRSSTRSRPGTDSTSTPRSNKPPLEQIALDRSKRGTMPGQLRGRVPAPPGGYLSRRPGTSGRDADCAPSFRDVARLRYGGTGAAPEGRTETDRVSDPYHRLLGDTVS